ncbi:MAG TPA: ferritin [Fimbriimonadaceae bacterium]|nr:ferritin [Fimbriimonadaceae bacterium]
MVTDRLKDMLVKQIASELSAHSMYFGIAIYFHQSSLDRWGELFRKQSREEAGHALKIMDFLIDNEVQFDIPGVSGAPTNFGTPVEACRVALESERRVSEQFQAMAAACMEEKDYRVFEFLQWFIKEQVEEEHKMQKLIDLLESGINPFKIQDDLDRYDSD